MTLEDSGEEVASPEDAGAEAAEEDALEDSGAEAGAREAGVLEAGAEQAASIRARTAARRIERFFHENHLNRKKHRNQQGAGVNAFLSKVGWSTPTFLTILRTFGRKENAGTVCGLAGVFQRRIAIHSALQLDDDFQRLPVEPAVADGSLRIVKNRGDFYNKSDCCEQTGGRVSEAGGKRMRKQMNFKMAVLILVGIVLLLQVMGALGIGVQKSSANLQIGYWEKAVPKVGRRIMFYGMAGSSEPCTQPRSPLRFM